MTIQLKDYVRMNCRYFYGSYNSVFFPSCSLSSVSKRFPIMSVPYCFSFFINTHLSVDVLLVFSQCFTTVPLSQVGVK